MSATQIQSEIKSEVDQRVPLQKLRETPEWSFLSDKQSRFCARYLESGLAGNYDAKSAMRSAYDSSSAKNLSCLTYEVLANPRVRAVLAIHFRQAPIDVFLADLEKTIRKEKGTAKVEALKLYAEIQDRKISGADVSKWGAPAQRLTLECETAESSSRFNVGDICVQDGKKYRVKAIDADGRPTDAEEI